MRLLLDTHTFLWFVFGSTQLSANVKQLIEDEANDKYLSIASVWEIAIKVSTGKLAIAQSLDVFFPDQLQRNDIQWLPLAWLMRVGSLPCRFTIKTRSTGS